MEYKDKTGRSYTIELETQLLKEAQIAKKQYETAKRYVFSQCHWLWRYGEKRYRLDTNDRAKNKNLKPWQSNITGGLARTFIDVFQSSLSENPIVPMGQPVGDTPQEVVDNAIIALTYSADKSNYQNESKVIMKQWLKTGQYAIRVWYTYKPKIQTYLTYDASWKPIERTLKKKGISVPYAKHVPVWNIYPDPYNNTNRYVSERVVVSFSTLIEDFWHIINHPYNKSPFKNPEFLWTLPVNLNWAELHDYGSITNEVLHKKNLDAQNSDSYYSSYRTQNINTADTINMQDSDKDVTDGLIEVIYTVTDDTIVIHANNYPIYIGKNFFWFINYVVRSATDETQTLWVEWVPYILSGVEETYDSFVNNLIDSARVTTTPNFIGMKWVFEDESRVEEMSPWDTLWVETPALNGEQPLRRLDKGSVTDNGLMQTMQSLATQKAGISEYNMGISAGERTATGAQSVANSDKKRLLPYIQSFLACQSQVMEMWLTLLIENWQTPQFVAIVGKNGETIKAQLTNADLAWDMTLSLDSDGLMAMKNDMNVKRLIEFFPQIMNSGITDSPWEVLAEIFRGLWLNPARFKINYEKKAPEAPLETINETPELTPIEEEIQSITENVTPQLNLNQS